MLEQFDLIIYDMDGLLIDSEPFWRRAEISVFATVGIHLTEDDCRKTTGFRFDEVVDYWYAQQPWTGKTKEQIHDEVIDEMERAILEDAEALSGVHQSLAYFASKGLKMAVASSSAIRLIKAMVKKLGIAHYFQLLVSAEHEQYGKPHPAVFIRTAEVLGVRPERCLVIEDSMNGLLAAKAAKMKCLLVPDKLHLHDPRFVLADWQIHSLEELPFNYLVRV